MYWTAAIGLLVALAVFGPWEPGWIGRLASGEAAYGRLLLAAFVFYVIGANAVYRLLLRFALLATDGEGIEQELRSAEGQATLNLGPRE